MQRTSPVVSIRKRAPEGAEAQEAELKPTIVQPPKPPEKKLGRPAVVALVAAGLLLGFSLFQALDTAPVRPGASGPTQIRTTEVAKGRFESLLRVGGTLGATNFAVIRAPRLRGTRDRGGGGGGGGSSMTIAFLADPGSMVDKGEVVVEFESKRTLDMMDSFESSLAQTRRRSASRMATLISAAATLEQDERRTIAEAEKAKLELGTAEVRSRIQAEILALQAQQSDAAAKQLKEELRLSRLADAAEMRIAEIDVEQQERRLERTEGDLEKMRLKSPVPGLVVVETMSRGGSFTQAAEGDTVNPGSAFLRIVDLSNMAVYADINQADAQLVDLGAPAKVRIDAYPGAVFEGRVSAIGAVASSGQSSGGGGRMRGSRGGSTGQWVRQVAIQIEILDADKRIMPDLSGSADIVVAQQEDALVIPRSALREADGRSVVWVDDEGKFAEREVVVAQLSDTEAVIGSGLQVGEVISVQPVTDQSMLREPLVAAGR